MVIGVGGMRESLREVASIKYSGGLRRRVREGPKLNRFWESKHPTPDISTTTEAPEGKHWTSHTSEIWVFETE